MGLDQLASNLSKTIDGARLGGGFQISDFYPVTGQSFFRFEKQCELRISHSTSNANQECYSCAPG